MLQQVRSQARKGLGAENLLHLSIYQETPPTREASASSNASIRRKKGTSRATRPAPHHTQANRSQLEEEPHFAASHAGVMDLPHLVYMNTRQPHLKRVERCKKTVLVNSANSGCRPRLACIPQTKRAGGGGTSSLEWRGGHRAGKRGMRPSLRGRRFT